MTTQNAATGTDPGSKSAAELECEVEQSRAHVEHTLDQIQQRLSPGQLIDQAVTYFRDGGGGEFTRNLGESVKQNPLPVALVAAGIGWMMLAGRQPARDSHRELRYWDDDPDSFAENDVDVMPEPSSYYAAGRSTGYGAGASSDSDAEPGIGDRLKDAGEAAKDKLDELGDQARGMGDQARQRAERTRRDLADGAHRAGRVVRHGGRQVKRTVLQTVNEQPLLLGAIGLAIGAALGAAVPPTETEDSLMGETRDEALRRAKEAGREQAHKAREVADAVVGAARDEAGRQATSAHTGASEAGARTDPSAGASSPG